MKFMKQISTLLPGLTFKPQSALYLIGFTLFLGSCQKESASDSSLNQSLISNSQQVNGLGKQDVHKYTVPFKASFVTSDVITQEATADNPIQIDHLTGTGEGSFIGRSSVDIIASGDITLPFPALVTSTATYSAANGDKIFTTGNGYVEEPGADGSLRLTGDATVTGGTGRFAGATGTWEIIATGNMFLPQGTLTIKGTITF
jgi:hypothetical protein